MEVQKNMELGERLAEMRREKGLTQADLAEAVNVSRQVVSKWETGVTTPGRANLKALSELYGVTVDALLREDWEVQRRPEAVPGTAAAAPVPEEAKGGVWKKRLLYALVTLLLMVLTAVGSWMFFSYQNRDRVIPMKELPVSRSEDEAEYQGYTFVVN